MPCPNCSRETAPESYFCAWCNVLVADGNGGTKAGLFVRFMALVIDPLVAVVLYVGAIALFGSMSADLGALVAVLLPLVYFVWFLMLLRRGLTPGKKLLGLQVVRAQTGAIPGFGTMFVRETFGRFLSGLIFGLGYFWAIVDRNGQAWHDRIAGTVVVRRR
jgi:uncharacterized RDD family membrane protein YckC